MEIFNLEPMDNPVFNGTFRFECHSSLFGNKHLDDDFKGIDRAKFAWKAHRFEPVWKPFEISGDVPCYQDYSADGGHAPVFSERAVNALRELLEPAGELLPLKTKVGPYYAFNIHAKSAALDLSQSNGRFAPKAKETALSFGHYVFDEQKLEGHAIFRLREQPAKIFVTDEFKGRCKAASLSSMEFIKAWPLPKGQDFIRQQKKVKRQREEETAPLRAQAVLVSLGLAGREATDEETDQALEIGNALSERLALGRKTEAEYIGNVLYYTESRKAAINVLVTPDADQLAEVVVPWATSSIDWPRAVTVIKQYVKYPEEGKTVRIKIK